MEAAEQTENTSMLYHHVKLLWKTIACLHIQREVGAKLSFIWSHVLYVCDLLQRRDFIKKKHFLRKFKTALISFSTTN